MNFVDPVRANTVGPYAFREHFETGSGSAFTISSVMTTREGWFKTRPYITFEFDVDGTAPFVLGEDIRLGSRVSCERRGIIYTDQIYGIRRTGTRTLSGRPVIAFGDNQKDKDPFARGMATVANVANFAAMLAGSGDMF